MARTKRKRPETANVDVVSTRLPIAVIDLMRAERQARQAAGEAITDSGIVRESVLARYAGRLAT